MFNDLGVPINDAEMNMLPPGQNQPLQKMMAESGVEMNINLLPIGLSMASSFFGGQSKRNAAKVQAAHAANEQKRAFANQAAQTAYSAEMAKQSADYYNKQTISDYDKSLNQYKDQITLNNKAANVAFAAESARSEEMYNKFAFKRNEMQKELMRSAGVARASRGSGSGYSRSRRRADMINTIGEFGRSNQMLARNLMSAERASKARMSGLAMKHEQHDMNAWSRVAIAPTLRFAGGGTPNLQAPGGAMPVPGYGAGDFMGDLFGGIMNYGGLKGTSSYIAPSSSSSSFGSSMFNLSQGFGF